jgi:hypothetical protein
MIPVKLFDRITCSLNVDITSKMDDISILADYFDAASAWWETLLTDPWEVTFNGSRSPQTRFDTNRMSSTFDLESNPCSVSFTEHFLVNVGAASRMWSVYSGKQTPKSGQTLAYRSKSS